MHAHLSLQLVAAVLLSALIVKAEPRALAKEMTPQLLPPTIGGFRVSNDTRQARPTVDLKYINEDDVHAMYQVVDGWEYPYNATYPRKVNANAMTRKDGGPIQTLVDLQAQGVLLDHGEDYSRRKWALLRYLDEDGYYERPQDLSDYEYETE